MTSVAGEAIFSASFNKIFVLVQSACGSPALFLPCEASQCLLGTQGWWGSVSSLGPEGGLGEKRARCPC